MFKSTVVFALALLSVADGKRILRGEKKERRTQQKNRQFTLLTNKESHMTAFHLEPGQEITPRGVRRFLAEDKQERRRRELRGGNGGKTGKSTEESSDGPEFQVTLQDDEDFFSLTGLSGEILNFIESSAALVGAICGTTACRGALSAVAEGYECDPDEDEFEDTCLDVIVHEDITGAEFLCPEPTDVMSILTATCVCTGGPNPSGTCTVPTMLDFNNPDYTFMAATDNCAGSGVPAVTATLVCESVIAGSSTSTKSSGKSKSKSKSKSRRQ